MKKFMFAIEGLIFGLKKDRSIKIQFFLGILAVLYCMYLQIQLIEWMIVIPCIGLVLVSEYFNTAIEKMCDAYTNNYSPVIKQIKDISSAAVFISALVSFIIMLLIIIKNGGIFK